VDHCPERYSTAESDLRTLAALELARFIKDMDRLASKYYREYILAEYE